MLGETAVREMVNQVLAFSGADQTEVIFQGSDSALTRVANSYIHQNVARSNVEIRVRVVDGNKIGVASTNDLSPEGIQHAVDAARAIAKLQRQDLDLQTFPTPQPTQSIRAVAEATANCTPEQRAQVMSVLCKKAREKGVIAAGAFSTTDREIAVANSSGVFAYHRGTIADINTVMMSDTGSGYASFAHQDMSEINAEAIADEAIDKALRARNPVALDPGAYTVLLEEAAVVDLLDFLATVAFSAQAVQENRSFMTGKFGSKVMSDLVSIWDDGCSPHTVPLPFDYEGVPRQKVMLVENGIARGVVYDTPTAQRDGRSSTGHSLPAPNATGPLAMHMFMSPGNPLKREMIHSVERGIWVTRVRTRVVHPMKVLITGMTRDGTFLIEHGEVIRPLKNCRFTTSYLDALNNVRAVSRETKLFYNDRSGASRTAPALLVDGFNFTGVTA